MTKPIDIQPLEAACRAHGLKLTHQRTEVYRTLAGSETHPSVEEIYRQVRRRIPSISPDTVYRTLDTLQRIGLIGRFNGPDGRARFDATIESHQHLVCTQCGRIEDIHWEELENLSLPDRPDWSNLALVQVELNGLCRVCQERTRPAGSTRH